MDELQTSAPGPGPEVRAAAPDLMDAEREEWREWRKSVDVRFGVGDRQFSRMRAELKRNTEITSEIREVVIAFAAFARFCKRVGRGVAWCGHWTFRILKVGGAIAASIAAIWGVLWAMKHGVPPPAVEEALPGHEQPQGRSGDRPGTSRK